MICNGHVTTYSYDSFNRRIAKTVDGIEELFLFQGQDEIGCWKNNVCQEVRLLGKSPYQRTVAIEIKGIPYVPLHDMKGNITALLDLEGDLVEQYRYTAYGESQISSASGDKHSHSFIGNPWQYFGKRFDKESGLIPFGMRYYSPHLSRWITKDPAGFTDGPNLYAYVHNNPLRYFDQYGLLAQELLKTATPGIALSYVAYENMHYGRFCTSIGSGEYCDDIHHINIEDKLEIGYNFRQSEGQAFQRTCTYSINDLTDSKTGHNYNYPALPPNKSVLFINGICNSMKTFQESLHHLAQITGYNISGVFCPTFGAQTDAICYFKTLFGAAFEGTRELQRNIQDFHQTAASDATMLLITHSRGTAYARNALRDLPSDLRNRVDTRAFAPGAFIDNSLCNSIGHYTSKRDVVPYLDFRGRQRCNDSIVTLQPAFNAPWFDHEFNSPTYTESLEIEFNDYIRN